MISHITNEIVRNYNIVTMVYLIFSCYRNMRIAPDCAYCKFKVTKRLTWCSHDHNGHYGACSNFKN